jgi:hypothetical protein
MEDFELSENELMLTTQYQMQKLEEMKQDLPKYIKKRKKEFKKELQCYLELNSVDGNFIPDKNRIPMFNVIQHTFSPLINVGGISPKYSADEMAMAFDFYKECTERLNEDVIYTPKIEDFCSMINISRKSFDKFQLNGEETIRDLCDKIQDYCVSKTADGAFIGVLDKVYSIFHQKSSNKQRDNEPIQNNVLIQNNTIMNDDQFKELASKYNFDN